MKKPTRVNHPPAVELPAGNHAVVAPIYQTVKFEFDTLAATEAFLRGERAAGSDERVSRLTALLVLLPDGSLIAKAEEAVHLLAIGP